MDFYFAETAHSFPLARSTFPFQQKYLLESSWRDGYTAQYITVLELTRFYDHTNLWKLSSLVTHSDTFAKFWFSSALLTPHTWYILC